MIPEAFIQEWSRNAPWNTPTKVEQDLIISRALVELFSQPDFKNHIAFRGGTAIHKLFLPPASRYSEDIDLVQVRAGPIGPLFDSARKALEPLLGKAQRLLGPGVVKLIFRFQPEGVPDAKMRLKIEINSREHFFVLGSKVVSFALQSGWFKGNAEIISYSLEELLGTKMRALYQRRKGRDLFDIWLGLTQGHARPHLIVKCFRRYMKELELSASAREFRLNMEAKLHHPDFLHDMDDLLRPGVEFNVMTAYARFDQEVLTLL